MFCLKDKSLADLDELVEDFIEDIEGALESYKAIIVGVNRKGQLFT